MLETLAWTLVHSVWQGLMIGAVAALALSTVTHRPRATHAVAMVALAAQLVASIGTALSDVATTIPAPALAEGTRILRSVASPSWMQWVVLAWAIGVALMGARLVLSVHASRQLRDRVQPLPAEVLAIVTELASRLGLADVQAAASNAIAGPQVVGVLTPVLLIPAATVLQLSPEQLRAVIAHELAHLLHHDPLTQAAQEAIAMLYFFHPVTWWLSNVARQSREHACDDVAAQLVGKKAIASALFELEQHRVDALALAASGQLYSRIQRLVQPKTHRHTRLAGGLAAAAVVMLVAAPALASERAAERDFRRLETRTEALIALSISAPADADEQATDEALKGSLDDKVQALEAVEAAALRVVSHEHDEWSAAAITQLGSAYEDMAVSLVQSTLPSYLNPDQADAYRMAMEDHAHVQYEKAEQAYQQAIELGGTTEWGVQAETRLTELARTRQQLAYSPTPLPAADPATYRADLAVAIPQVAAFQERCGANPELSMLMDQMSDEAAIADPDLLAEFQDMVTDLLTVTAPTSDCPAAE